MNKVRYLYYFFRSLGYMGSYPQLETLNLAHNSIQASLIILLEYSLQASLIILLVYSIQASLIIGVVSLDLCSIVSKVMLG